MHVVFWELEDDEDPGVCAPSTTFASSPLSKNGSAPTLTGKAGVGDGLLPYTSDQPLIMSHNDTDIVCALSGAEDDMDNTVTAGADASIGSTTLLDCFEGLSHNDIITLTLVELKADSEKQPLPPGEKTPDVTVYSKNEIADSTQDSSCAAPHSETCQDPDSESSSSGPDSRGGSSSDPTFVPGVKRGRGRGIVRGKAVDRQKGKKAATSSVSPPASSKPPTNQTTTPDSPPPVESTKQTSPVSSTDTSHPSASSKSSSNPPTVDQNARWSFLLSKHPQNLVQNPIATIQMPTPVMPVKPIHSTPNPVRRQQIPGGLFPKPQLRTEESDGVPMKAAGMYGAFGAKSSPARSPLPPPAPNLLEPITGHYQKSQINTTVVSGSSPPGGTLPEISIKKHSSQASDLQGLSKTEVLRHKLIKKLKAKKKKLEKLNKILGNQGEASLPPDSTDLSSPHTVSSSTYDGCINNDFLSGLLSPATTASNLSPDSSGLLEILASGQEGGDQVDGGINAVVAAPQTDFCASQESSDNFLKEFLSQAATQRPTEMETEALFELDMYM